MAICSYIFSITDYFLFRVPYENITIIVKYKNSTCIHNVNGSQICYINYDSHTLFETNHILFIKYVKDNSDHFD